VMRVRPIAQVAPAATHWRWRAACRSSARAWRRPATFPAHAVLDPASARSHCWLMAPAAQPRPGRERGKQTGNRRSRSRKTVCATRRPHFLGLTSRQNRCRRPMSKAPLFPAIVCRKFATEAAMFWQLSRRRNVMQTDGPCLLAAKMPRALAAGAGCARPEPIVR
jgi:hypothetical protein